MAHGPSAQGAAQKELEAGSLNLSEIFRNRFWRVQTWLQFESEEMKLESFLIHYIVLHYQKKLLPTRCTYVSCGPLVLVFFESPSASLEISDASADKVNAEAPTFALSSWVSFLGFKPRAALDSANVSKYQPWVIKYQPYKNGIDDDWGANGFFVAPRTDPSCRVRFEPGRNSVETVRHRDVPRLRGRGEAKSNRQPSKSASFQNGKIIEGSCGRICLRHFKPSFYKAELGMVPWYRVSFQRKNISAKHYKMFLGNRCSIRLLRNIIHHLSSFNWTWEATGHVLYLAETMSNDSVHHSFNPKW